MALHALPPGNYRFDVAGVPGFEVCTQNADPAVPNNVISGDNFFNNVQLDPTVIRGPFNFGEMPNSTADSVTKGQFLTSTSGGTAGLAVNPNVALSPSFSITTGAPLVATLVATGAGAGGQPMVRVFNYATGNEIYRFMAYDPSFMGGVRVAVGDVTGDGVPDIVTVPGAGGGPDVRVFSGATGQLVREFQALDGKFTGGLNVAVADVNGDGVGDIIIGAGAGGGPQVAVYSGVDGSTLQMFYAYDQSFTGGVSVAGGDLNGSGFADIVTGAGAGGGPNVRVFDGQTGAMLASFFAYDQSFAGGVNVAVGKGANGRSTIVTGAAPAAAPRCGCTTACR